MTILIISGIWGGVTSAVKSAVGFVSSAVRRGLGVEESYESISTYLPQVSEAEWGAQYDIYDESIPAWERINQLPSSYTVQPEWSLPTSLDYRQEHIMRIRVQATELETGNIVEQWITVESDRPLTLGEWQEGAEFVTSESLTGTDLVILDYMEYEYFTKA